MWAWPQGSLKCLDRAPTVVATAAIWTAALLAGCPADGAVSSGASPPARSQEWVCRPRADELLVRLGSAVA